MTRAAVETVKGSKCPCYNSCSCGQQIGKVHDKLENELACSSGSFCNVYGRRGIHGRGWRTLERDERYR